LDSNPARDERGAEPLTQEADRNLLIHQAVNAVLRISLDPTSLDEPLQREVRGVLEYFSRELRQPDDKLIRMMSSFGSQIAQFIDHRQAREELQRQGAERRIARQIQQGLLPRAMPGLPGFRMSGRSAAAYDVGGTASISSPCGWGARNTSASCWRTPAGTGSGPPCWWRKLVPACGPWP